MSTNLQISTKQVRLRSDLHKKLKLKAFQDGKPLSKALADLVDEALEGQSEGKLRRI